MWNIDNILKIRNTKPNEQREKFGWFRKAVGASPAVGSGEGDYPHRVTTGKKVRQYLALLLGSGYFEGVMME